MLANMVCSLIKHRRITTTLAKAKAARSVAEKMITLGKAGTLHDRRLAAARFHQDEEAVKILFTEIAPTQKERRGGYTRIVRLGGASGKNRAYRQGDAAEMVILEFVDVPVPEEPAPGSRRRPRLMVDTACFTEPAPCERAFYLLGRASPALCRRCGSWVVINLELEVVH
jgi:large subunit ribosomal protein L17